ncbi:hypothetical protein ES703_121175 [subsurface metagenome]
MNEQEKRQVAALAVAVLVDMGIEISTISAMLKCSRQEVYRWLGGFFLPRERMCGPVNNLLKRAGEIKTDWTDIVTSWNHKYHRATLLTLYKKPARRILDSGLALDEKIEKLTAWTLNEWAKKAVKQ